MSIQSAWVGGQSSREELPCPLRRDAQLGPPTQTLCTENPYPMQPFSKGLPLTPATWPAPLGLLAPLHPPRSLPSEDTTLQERPYSHRHGDCTLQRTDSQP